ncbi:AmmeMemoRadiSam system protein A [compost metagenome]
MQLPFLQTVLEYFRIVPLTLGMVEPALVSRLLDTLWGGPETLIVVSSDLSHYLDYRHARLTDADSADHVLHLRAELDHEQACGATGINALLLSARRRQLTPHLLDLRNSGDTAGDHSRVVGYAAFSFSETAAGEAEIDSQALGRALLSQARDSIDEFLGLPCRGEPAEHPLLDEPGACFVTLRIGGLLRGCVGQLQPKGPLREAVRANARAAASEDPRFPPLSFMEWEDTTLDVSVLSPVQFHACPDLDSALALIEVGVDGVVLEGGGCRSTFLPQVWRQLPNPRDFLLQLLRKAGLDAWPADMRLGRYRVWEHHEAGDSP